MLKQLLRRFRDKSNVNDKIIKEKIEEEVPKYRVRTYGFDGQTKWRHDATHFNFSSIAGVRIHILRRMLASRLPVLYYEVHQYAPRTAATGRVYEWKMVEKGNYHNVLQWLLPEDDPFYTVIYNRLNETSFKHKYHWPGHRFTSKQIQEMIEEFYAGTDDPVKCDLCHKSLEATYGLMAQLTVLSQLQNDRMETKSHEDYPRW